MQNINRQRNDPLPALNRPRAPGNLNFVRIAGKTLTRVFTLTHRHPGIPGVVVLSLSLTNQELVELDNFVESDCASHTLVAIRRDEDTPSCGYDVACRIILLQRMLRTPQYNLVVTDCPIVTRHLGDEQTTTPREFRGRDFFPPRGVIQDTMHFPAFNYPIVDVNLRMVSPLVEVVENSSRYLVFARDLLLRTLSDHIVDNWRPRTAGKYYVCYERTAPVRMVGRFNASLGRYFDRVRYNAVRREYRFRYEESPYVLKEKDLGSNLRYAANAQITPSDLRVLVTKVFNKSRESLAHPVAVRIASSLLHYQVAQNTSIGFTAEEVDAIDLNNVMVKDFRARIRIPYLAYWILAGLVLAILYSRFFMWASIGWFLFIAPGWIKVPTGSFPAQARNVAKLVAVLVMFMVITHVRSEECNVGVAVQEPTLVRLAWAYVEGNFWSVALGLVRGRTTLPPHLYERFVDVVAVIMFIIVATVAYKLVSCCWRPLRWWYRVQAELLARLSFYAMVIVLILFFFSFPNFIPAVAAHRGTTPEPGSVWREVIYALIVFLIVVGYDRYIALNHSYKEFRRRIIEEKLATPFDGKALLPYFPDMESHIDVQEFTPDPKGRIFCDDVSYARPRNSFLIVGVVSSLVFVSQYSSSVNCAIKGLQTRVLIKTKFEVDVDYLRAVEIFFPELFLYASDTDHILYRPPLGQLGEEVYPWGSTTTDFEQWNERFHPNRRKHNVKAYAKYLRGGHSETQDHYKAFVKRELTPDITVNEYQEGRPRIILSLADHPKFARSTWVYSVYLALKKCWHNRHVIFMASGVTLDELNFWMNYNADLCGGDFVFLTMDFSKFDVHQTRPWIEREVTLFERLGAKKYIEPWSSVVNTKFQTRGFVQTGGKDTSVSFKKGAMRHSGEPETTLGNTIICANVARSFVESRFNRSATAGCGDDNATVIPLWEVTARYGTNWEAALEADFVQHCNKLGFSITLQITVSDEILRAEFLSLRFYPVDGLYCAGKKPGRNLAKIGFQKCSPNRDMDECLEIWAATLRSYLPSASHVPFLRAYIEECMDHCIALGYRGDIELPKKYHTWVGEVHRPSDDTFEAFEEYYGLSAKDEEDFRLRLRDHLEEFGLCSVWSERVVEDLFTLDQ